MSILAHRVGRIPTPTLITQTICYRCGIVFDPATQKVVHDAPCRDCRQVLRAEGDTTHWGTRPQRPRQPRKKAA